jgi:tetratricopeptide (TPR) repeat protein
MMPAMRLIICAISTLFIATGAAHADQTDSRLDRLFEELRTGDARDANATAARIEEIWSDSQSDTVDLLFHRALAALDAGEIDLSGALLDTAIGLSPHFAQAYAVRGSIRLRQDDQPGAVADFNRTIELEPRQFEARIALAELMMASGDDRGAYEMLQHALEWNPHEEHARERARKLRNRIDGREI